ncbi:hypothetical protein JVT61DRAFT_12235 [Boletus reticuloceps]|uniref:Uncharacterized protein n=1 Tax=Boletus reticuloceps TaxID=495285 RepID=A0A8I2YE62_9AGAM|nr:hypothetical protein JVT61DRAFT_12235 [Boletus reticuloceps]
MTGGDIELSVCTVDIGVLSAIDSNVLLGDEEREREWICLLLFDAEARGERPCRHLLPAFGKEWQMNVYRPSRVVTKGKGPSRGRGSKLV